MTAIRGINNGISAISDRSLRKISPTYRTKRKYDSELHYWKRELGHLKRWYEEGTDDWWAIPAPSPDQKQRVSNIWAFNAVMTMHHLRPSYLEELQLESDFFRGKRVLEVGCGPLAPILQFSDCIRHGLDPLIDLYVESGWPLYAYDVTFVNARGESMPYADSYFDAVIAVNALDHVDDVTWVAFEIQRVVKVGGGLYFEIEYHAPTVNEPQRLDDTILLDSFSSCNMRKVLERGKKDLFQAIINRFGLVRGRFDHFSNDERLVAWHGQRKR